MRPKEETTKNYSLVKVWVESFQNYIMILIIMCKNLAVDLISRMLVFSNQIIWLSVTYQIISLITMTLEYHSMIIQKNQLEPANWKISSNFLDIYYNASTHKSFSVSKRARASTDIAGTCHNFNREKCDLDKNCKFTHICSKCGGLHTARQCKSQLPKESADEEENEVDLIWFVNVIHAGRDCRATLHAGRGYILTYTRWAWLHFNIYTLGVVTCRQSIWFSNMLYTLGVVTGQQSIRFLNMLYTLGVITWQHYTLGVVTFQHIHAGRDCMATLHAERGCISTYTRWARVQVSSRSDSSICYIRWAWLHGNITRWAWLHVDSPTTCRSVCSSTLIRQPESLCSLFSPYSTLCGTGATLLGP